MQRGELLKQELHWVGRTRPRRPERHFPQPLAQRLAGAPSRGFDLLDLGDREPRPGSLHPEVSARVRFLIS